jgi:hypothetical protein
MYNPTVMRVTVFAKPLENPARKYDGLIPEAPG